MGRISGNTEVVESTQQQSAQQTASSVGTGSQTFAAQTATVPNQEVQVDSTMQEVDAVEAPATLTGQRQVAETTAPQAQTTTVAANAATMATTPASTAQTKTAEPSHSSKPSFRQAAAAGYEQPAEGLQRPEAEDLADVYEVPEFTRAQKAPTASEKPAKAPVEPEPTKRSAWDYPKAQSPENLAKQDFTIDKPDAQKFSLTGLRNPFFTKRKQKEVMRNVERKSAVPTGNNIVAKLVAGPDANLSIRDVSLGSNIVLAAIQQPGNLLLQRVNERAGTEYTPEQFIGEDGEANILDLMEVINKNKIYVTLSKNPITDPQSFQRRVLKVHVGDGIKVHPLAVKAFNADFDGDEACLHLDAKNLQYARDAVAYLIGVDGSSMLDSDFFLVYNFGSRDLMERFFVGEFARFVSDPYELAEAYQAVAGGAKDMTYLLRTIYELTDGKEANVARVIDGLYRKQNDTIRLANAYAIDDNEDYELPEDTKQAKNLTREEAYILGIYEGAKRGSLPPNYQQFLVEMSRFTGDIAGKNPQFRMGADFAKQIKRSQKTYIGEDGMFELWQETAAGAMAQAMSARAFFGEKKMYENEWLRTQVISEVGMPSKYPSLDQFVAKFIDSYNRHATIVQMARTQWTTSGEYIAPNSKANYIQPQYDRFGACTNTYGSFTKQFIKIYGDFTVDYIFGKNVAFSASSPSASHGSWTENKTRFLLWKYKDMTIREFAYNNRLRYSTKDPRSKNLNVNDKEMMWKFLDAIADTKTSKARDFNKTTAVPAFEAMAEVIEKYKNLPRDAAEFKELRDTYLNALAMTHPDMFAYFGMDNPTAFAESEWGKRILEPGADLASIRMAMVYEWRTGKITNIKTQMRGADPETRTELRNKLSYECDTLKSVSDAWYGIVRETEGRNKHFRQYMETGHSGYMMDDGTHWKSHAAEAGFKFPGNYESIADVMRDPYLPYEQKAGIIADVAIGMTNYPHITPTEMMYQLELRPASTYVGVNISGFEEDLDNPLKAGLDYLTRASKKDVSSKQRPEKEVQYYEQALKKDMRSAAAVSPYVYADAIVSVYEKSFDDSEKAKQQATVNAIYLALSESQNGGLYNDVFTLDNAAMGRIGWDQISRKDILEVLVNDASIPFYDRYGNMGTLSRETLGVGDNLTEWLNDHPRVNELFCTGAVNVEHDGSITVNQSNLTVDPDVAMLMDHPGFGALCSLFVPASGRTAGNARSEMVKMMHRLTRWIKTHGVNPNDPIFEKLNHILDDARVDEDTKMYLGNEVLGYMQTYAKELGVTGFSLEPMPFEFDRASVNSFYDVRQVLSAAKTATSTGVEGGMTKAMALTQGYLWMAEDSYISTAKLSEEERQQYAGAPTTDGTPYDPSQEGPFIIYVEGVAAKDELLDSSGNQITSLARRFIVKRSKSGEDFNTKAKKQGNDGKDSITKKVKYTEAFKNWPAFEQYEQEHFKTLMTNEGADPQVVIEAIRWDLAQRLVEEDRSVGYTDMDEVDMMNVARLLCVTDGERVVFRTWSQINAVLQTRLPGLMPDLDQVEAFDNDTIRNKYISNCRELIETVGMVEAEVDVLEAAYGIRRIGPHLDRKRSVTTARRQRISSTERNLARLSQMIDSKTTITEPQKRGVSANVRQLIKEEVPRGYFYLGTASNEGLDFINQPGYGNVIYIQPGTDAAHIQDAISAAQANSMTLMFTDPSVLEQMGEYRRAVNMLEESHVFTLPFFDLELNGWGSTQSGSFWMSPSNVVFAVEDPYGLHDYADASVVPSQALYDRVNVNDEGDITIPVSSLFANTMEALDDPMHPQRYIFRIATAEEIEQLRTDDTVPIDLQVKEGNSYFEKIIQRLWNKMDIFFNNGGELPGRTYKQDEFCGWAVCVATDERTGEVTKYYAPLDPFGEWDTRGAGRTAPAEYVVNNMYYEDTTGNFVVSYRNTAIMEHRAVKFHEGNSAANKEMMFMEPRNLGTFKNGVPIDAMVSPATTASRRNGDNSRIQTMVTAMFMTYCCPEYRYNFAEAPGSFPKHPELKAKLLAGRITTGEWERISSGMQWHSDPEMNAIVATLVSKALRAGVNPSDILANQYQDATIGWYNADNFYEFETIMDTTYTFEDAWLKFMHLNNPTLVQNGLYDASDGNYLFRVNTDGEAWNYGCLQLQIPTPYGTYVWANVYASFSFFGEDNTAFKRAGMNGSQLGSLDMQQTVHGGKADGNLFIEYLKFALAGNAPVKVKNTTPNVAEFRGKR